MKTNKSKTAIIIPKSKGSNKDSGGKGDNGADKSGTDTDSDKTRINEPEKEKGQDKFDKPKREVNPDTTRQGSSKNGSGRK